MVVLSAAICTNSGKPLLARQFKEMTKDSITAYLTNFSSLLLENDSQHTTIESDLIRYLYQPVESFILLIITNLNSNIIQDIDTLQLVAKTVSSLLRGSSVSSSIGSSDIFLNSFEILNAFDEIITEGYKENLTPQLVSQFLEMDSFDERIQDAIDRNKELGAAEERKRKAKEIQRKELARREAENLASLGVGSGLGSTTGGFGAGSSAGLGGQPSIYNTPSYEDEEEDPTTAYARAGTYKAPHQGRGLQLGKKKQGNNSDFTPLLSESRPNFRQQQQQRVAAEEEQRAAQLRTPALNKPEVPEVENNGILITVNEKVSAEILRDGSLKSSEIKGDLQLRINNADLAHSKLILSPLEKKTGLQFKTHPNVDKAKFNSNIIALKDQNKSFPSNDQSLGVLRWRALGKDEDTLYLPITFSIWTTEQNGLVSVTIEYELQEKLIDEQIIFKDLEILIPDVGGANAYLKSDDDDNIVFNQNEDSLQFVINQISYEDPSGAIEFTVETSEEDYLFPMYVNFVIQSNKLNFAGVEIQDVLSVDNEEESLPYDFVSNVISENFTIV